MIDIRLYDGQITKNFNIAEFKCKANGEMLLNEAVIEHIQRLQKFRDWYNRVMIITSGYRTPEYNESIGGNLNSQHLKALVSDFALPNEFQTYSSKRQYEYLQNVRKKWGQLCKESGIRGGVGWYNTFVHLDSRTGVGDIVFWNSRY